MAEDIVTTRATRTLGKMAKSAVAAIITAVICVCAVPTATAIGTAVPNGMADVASTSESTIFPGGGLSANAVDSSASVAAGNKNASAAPVANAGHNTVADAFVTSSDAEILADGTAPWDEDDAAGDDSSNNNRKVRSFDTVTYKLNVHADTNDHKTQHPNATFGFVATLPYSSKQIKWDTSGTGVYGATTTYDIPDGNGGVYSMITGYYDWESTTGSALPGITGQTFKVQVLGLHNGQIVQPNFKAWMNGGTDDPADKSADALYKNTVLKSCEPPEVTVSAALRLNVVLTPTTSTGYGTYDFTTGSDKAPNKHDGEYKRVGYLYGMGVGLQLRNKDKTRGLRGVELPDPNSDIKVHVDFNAQYSDDEGKTKKDIPTGFEPLIWSVDANDGYRDNYTDKTDRDGRSTTSMDGVKATKDYAAHVPGNNTGFDAPRTTQRYNEVENGGTWSATYPTPASTDITVSGAKITDWLFPYAGLGNTVHSYYTPDIDDWTKIKDVKDITQDPSKVSEAYFSAGKIWVLQPTYKSTDGTKDDDDFMVQNGIWTLYMNAKEKLTSAYSISDPQYETNADGTLKLVDGKPVKREGAKEYTEDDQVISPTHPDNSGANDDEQVTNQVVEKAPGGGMNPTIRYTKDVNTLRDVDGTLNCWNSGCDRVSIGREMAVLGGLVWNPHNSYDNIASAMNVLMKYDSRAFETTGEARMVEDPVTNDPSQLGAWKARWGYLLGNDGKEYPWPSDEAMNKALENYSFSPKDENGNVLTFEQDGKQVPVVVKLTWDSAWQGDKATKTPKHNYVATLFEERDQYAGDEDCVSDYKKHDTPFSVNAANLSRMSHSPFVGLKVREDLSLVGHVYATTVYARVWTNKDVNNESNEFPVLKDKDGNYLDREGNVLKGKALYAKDGKLLYRIGADNKVIDYTGQDSGWTLRGDAIVDKNGKTVRTIKDGKVYKSDDDGNEVNTGSIADETFRYVPSVVDETANGTTMKADPSFPVTKEDGKRPYIGSETGTDEGSTYDVNAGQLKGGQPGTPGTYNKWVYKEDGATYQSGSNDAHLGDSVYIIPYLSTVSIQHSQDGDDPVDPNNPKGPKKPRDTYNLSYGQRTDDFTITPELVQDAASGEKVKTGVATEVKIKVSLPWQLTYVSGSGHYGGTYQQPWKPGYQGKETDGEENIPEVTWEWLDKNGNPTTDKTQCAADGRQPDGCRGHQVLTFTIKNVKIQDGKLKWSRPGHSETDGKIYYSTKIGDMTYQGWDRKNLPNGDSFTTTVSITTTEDQRKPDSSAKVPNVTTIQTNILRDDAAHFFKTGDNPSRELNEDMAWKLGVFNTSSTADQNVYLIDSMPYSGFNKSQFDGKYYVSDWIADDNKENSGLSMASIGGATSSADSVDSETAAQADGDAQQGADDFPQLQYKYDDFKYHVYYTLDTKYQGKNTKKPRNGETNSNYLAPEDLLNSVRNNTTQDPEKGWVELEIAPVTVTENGKTKTKYQVKFPAAHTAEELKNAQTRADDLKYCASGTYNATKCNYQQPIAWAIMGVQAPESQMDIRLSVHQSDPDPENYLYNTAAWDDFGDDGNGFRVQRTIKGRIWIDEDHDGVQNKVCDTAQGHIAVGACGAESYSNNSEPSMSSKFNTYVTLYMKNKDGRWVRATDVWGEQIPAQATSKESEPGSCTEGGKEYTDCVQDGTYQFTNLPEGEFRVLITNGNPDDGAGNYSTTFPGYTLTGKNVYHAAYDDWRDSKGASEANASDGFPAGDYIPIGSLPSAQSIYQGGYQETMFDAGYWPGYKVMPHSGTYARWSTLALISVMLLAGGAWMLRAHDDKRQGLAVAAATPRHAASRLRG